MDVSAMAGGGEPSGEAQEPNIEYTATAVAQAQAQAALPVVSGEVKLAIGENALRVTALFDVAEIAYAEMNALVFADYAVTVRADCGEMTFSRMGEWAQRFYDALCDAYNRAVLRALFVEGTPVVTAKGEIRYAENGVMGGGSAPVHVYVYGNSVVSLPPDCSARRVPLCFVDGMEKGDYSLTLILDTGESYTYAKLGYDTAPVEAAVEKQIRALREKTLAAVKEIDPSLTMAQASQIAGLMPSGVAASVGQLAGIAPSFIVALEAKIAATRAADSYGSFKELCNPEQIWVGFRKNETGKSETGKGGDSVGLVAETAVPDPYLLWLIAPSPDGQFAAVEFAEADSATFVYRTGGDFTAFAQQINRALEAIGFKREVIRMSDAELRKPDNADYYMATKRTPALQFVRANFVGRVIHASVENWKRKLTEMWSDKNTAPTEPRSHV